MFSGVIVLKSKSEWNQRNGKLRICAGDFKVYVRPHSVGKDYILFANLRPEDTKPSVDEQEVIYRNSDHNEFSWFITRDRLRQLFDEGKVEILKRL